jgi:hypothetical protein
MAVGSVAGLGRVQERVVPALVFRGAAGGARRGRGSGGEAPLVEHVAGRWYERVGVRGLGRAGQGLGACGDWGSVARVSTVGC